MDVIKDPAYTALFNKSYAQDDWRARLVIGILENAIHDLLGYRSPNHLVKGAEEFIYEDNEMFQLCMDVLGYDSDIFRTRIATMKVTGERMRKSSQGIGGSYE